MLPVYNVRDLPGSYPSGAPPNPLPRGERGPEIVADTLLATARARLDEAVDALHASGNTDDVPPGYLARAALFRTTGDFGLAAQDVGDAADIADRSGLKLFQADIALERARLMLARAEPDAATLSSGLADAAAAIIAQAGYNRRLPDLALVRARIAIANADPAAARPHLDEAARFIADGWRCHVPEHDELATLCDAPPAPPLAQSEAPQPKSASRKTLWQRLGLG